MESYRKIIEKTVILLHKGEYEEKEEMETFSEIDLTDRKELEGSLREEYKIKELPCILAYGKVYSVEEIEKVKEKEREVENAQLDSAVELIRQNKRVIFIKGTPQRPECRFSREFVQILQEEGLVPEKDYKSINVLDSPAVREGIKKYGDWPTYPQVYVDSELAGGLDVIKAEREKGNLRACLGLDKA